MLARLNNFQQRFLMSFLGIAFLALFIFSSHVPPFQYLFVAALAFAQGCALWEYFTLSQTKGVQPLKMVATIASGLYIVLHFFLPDTSLVIPFLFVVLALAFICHFSRAEQAITNLACTLFGLIYITIPLGFLLDINFMQTSAWIIYLLVTTKITDTAAYIAGKLLGSHPLAPMLSPKKTREGAIAGLFGAIASSLAFFYTWDKLGLPYGTSFSWLEAILLGLSIGIISQIGDLAESLLKRDAQVKDSSTLPGFGGMLDVVDSMIFTTPLLYFWLQCKGLL